MAAIAALTVMAALFGVAATVTNNNNNDDNDNNTNDELQELAQIPPPQYTNQKHLYDKNNKLYIPQASQSAHPGNLPAVESIYKDPAADPDMVNEHTWDYNQPDTQSFEDSFHTLQTDNNPEQFINTEHPYGLLPHFKGKNQSTLYIEGLSPMEFNTVIVTFVFNYIEHIIIIHST